MGRWVYYALDLDALASLRAALGHLLTPAASATTTCACSDCGTGPKAPSLPLDLQHLPLLTEAMP